MEDKEGVSQNTMEQNIMVIPLCQISKEITWTVEIYAFSSFTNCFSNLRNVKVSIVQLIKNRRLLEQCNLVPSTSPKCKSKCPGNEVEG